MTIDFGFSGRSVRTLAAAIGLSACIMTVSAPAGAVDVAFSGGASGTDPLGHNYSATNDFKPSWGIPGLGAGTVHFNTGAFSNGAGTFATSFLVTILGGVDGAIDTTAPSGPFGFEYTTRFSNISDSELWDATFIGPLSVRFDAPAGHSIDVGEEFFVNVSFTGPVNLDQFSFAAAWSDTATAVPEPTSLAIVGGALAGLGLLRRKHRAA